MTGRILSLVVACVSFAPAAAAEEVVRLGNLELAHYGAVSYMTQLGGKCGIKVEERFFADRYPKDLWSGMRQRVAIARVLAIDSPILLMDEPFGALDALTRRSLQDELLRVWAELPRTILFVTHSIEESIYLADRIVAMTYRPGTIKRELRVALPRPRDLGSPGVNQLARELTELVMAEQRRHEAAERGPLDDRRSMR